MDAEEEVTQYLSMVYSQDRLVGQPRRGCFVVIFGVCPFSATSFGGFSFSLSLSLSFFSIKRC
jgi:hypothetical protein